MYYEKIKDFDKRRAAGVEAGIQTTQVVVSDLDDNGERNIVLFAKKWDDFGHPKDSETIASFKMKELTAEIAEYQEKIDTINQFISENGL